MLPFNFPTDHELRLPTLYLALNHAIFQAYNFIS